MKLASRLAIAFCFIIMLTSVALGQKASCSCTSPDKSCYGTANCQGGCTAFCGARDTCYFGCRVDWVYRPITIRFTEKTGKQMIQMVARRLNVGRSQRVIEFKPFEGEEKRKFNLELKNDSLWRLFDFLSKHGTIKIRGEDFGAKLIPLRDYTTTGEVSITLNRVSLKYVISELSFLTGHTFRLSARDAKRPVSISVEKATLDEILLRIYEETGIRVTKL